MLGPKERFSSRVDDYVKYRPFYPNEVLSLLQEECGLTYEWHVADVGSGPGNLARLFLANGNRVTGIEPNREMREAGEQVLGGEARFSSLDGSAEATGLGDGSIDLITAGQAFHWFDQRLARLEFERILKPTGWVALVWNMRQVDGSSFSRRYEAMLRMLPEYEKVKADSAPLDELREFFTPGILRQATFPSEQRLSHDAFLGRVLSSSYVPQRGTVGHEEVVESLNALFEAEAVDGEVRFGYDTQVFYGQFHLGD